MRIRALVIRIVRQFLHDKRSMALLIVAPLLVLSLMYLVFNGDTYEPKIGTVQLPEAVSQTLGENGADVTAYDSEAEAEEALAEREVDAIIRLDGAAPAVKLEGSDPARNRAVMAAVQKAMQAQQGPGGSPAGAAQAPVIEYLHGSEDMSSFDNFGPVLIGLFAFFFVFLIAGVSFLKERTSGTLERLLATPLRRWEIVAGYMIGFGIFTSIQAALIAGYTIGVLGSLMAGSFGCVLLIMLLLSLTALSFGTFLSAFANTEFQMIQFIPLVIVPQVFFSGLFDLESISPWLRWLSYITPLKYGADALRGVMIRGEGWSAIAPDIGVLLALTLVFMAANVLALRKHRKI
ncbi:ABC transporter permease [Paenibacillus arenilitoris]|uniref:ABC transporter permease n=1 Tax=Paenibacillus arenilitoris TaxID=2772299 RepID=A0A927H7B0_9BACL|nr:ABC transporter permease [Paenibacillus arenilitoris]MBD2870845.1 ABC transporter permease [Paenibacillus arenilitoris]